MSRADLIEDESLPAPEDMPREEIAAELRERANAMEKSNG